MVMVNDTLLMAYVVPCCLIYRFRSHPFELYECLVQVFVFCKKR